MHTLIGRFPVPRKCTARFPLKRCAAPYDIPKVAAILHKDQVSTTVGMTQIKKAQAVTGTVPRPKCAADVTVCLPADLFGGNPDTPETELLTHGCMICTLAGEQSPADCRLNGEESVKKMLIRMSGMRVPCPTQCQKSVGFSKPACTDLLLPPCVLHSRDYPARHLCTLINQR
jgi:hypothetical protein